MGIKFTIPNLNYARMYDTMWQLENNRLRLLSLTARFPLEIYRNPSILISHTNCLPLFSVPGNCLKINRRSEHNGITICESRINLIHIIFLKTWAVCPVLYTYSPCSCGCSYRQDKILSPNDWHCGHPR